MAEQPAQGHEARKSVSTAGRGASLWDAAPARRSASDPPARSSFDTPARSSFEAPRAASSAPGSAGLQTQYPGAAGLEAGMLVVLAYLLGWFGGLLVYLLERRDVEVRFHAAQSMLIDLSLLGLAIAFWPVGLLLLGPLALLAPVGTGLVAGPVLLLIALLLLSVVGGAWVLRVVLAVKGYRLEHISLPVVGTVAERWALRPV